MKALLTCALLLTVAFYSQVMANPIPCGGRISAYGDPGATSCGIYDTAPGLLTIYIIHMPWNGAKGASFMAPKPDCFTATFIADVTPWPVVGDFQSGISVSYGACQMGPVLVGQSLYLADGSTEQCCFYLTLPHPGSMTGEMEEVRCDDQVVGIGTMGIAQINPSGNWCVSPVEETTWGKVKSLYDQ